MGSEKMYNAAYTLENMARFAMSELAQQEFAEDFPMQEGNAAVNGAPKMIMNSLGKALELQATVYTNDMAVTKEKLTADIDRAIAATMLEIGYLKGHPQYQDMVDLLNEVAQQIKEPGFLLEAGQDRYQYSEVLNQLANSVQNQSAGDRVSMSSEFLMDVLREEALNSPNVMITADNIEAEIEIAARYAIEKVKKDIPSGIPAEKMIQDIERTKETLLQDWKTICEPAVTGRGDIVKDAPVYDASKSIENYAKVVRMVVLSGREADESFKDAANTFASIRDIKKVLEDAAKGLPANEQMTRKELKEFMANAMQNVMDSASSGLRGKDHAVYEAARLTKDSLDVYLDRVLEAAEKKYDGRDAFGKLQKTLKADKAFREQEFQKFNGELTFPVMERLVDTFCDEMRFQILETKASEARFNAAVEKGIDNAIAGAGNLVTSVGKTLSELGDGLRKAGKATLEHFGHLKHNPMFGAVKTFVGDLVEHAEDKLVQMATKGELKSISQVRELASKYGKDDIDKDPKTKDTIDRDQD